MFGKALNVSFILSAKLQVLQKIKVDPELPSSLDAQQRHIPQLLGTETF